MAVTVKIDLPQADAVIKRLGLDANGDTQRFHTLNVLRRIQKYMPMDSGAFIKTTVANTSDTKIVSVGAHAAYLFYGKVMVNAKTGKGPGFISGVGYRYRKGTTLTPTGRDLKYSKEKNPQAGARWDLAVMANEGEAITADLQRYIDRRTT